MLSLALLTSLLVQDPSPETATPPPRPAAIEDADLVAALKVAALTFTADERALMLRDVRDNRRTFTALRDDPPAHDELPALTFAPLGTPPALAPAEPIQLPELTRPETDEDLAFLSIRELAALVRSRQVTCVELTDVFLARLERVDATLHCVVSLLPERARARAAELDALLDEGTWLGPLHGIPYGAKDLLAARGAPTTWGAAPYRDQVFDRDAAVIRHLEARGAVLVAKLSLGALAWGDVWFGGRTRNPWNPEQGSSGSSAGPAAATAAAAVPFAIGSETLGSIISPSARCGVTGLRPTFGVVDVDGAMVLSFSMDKLGPMCRSAEDAALVLEGMLPADAPGPRGFRFAADVTPDGIEGMRVGVLADAFADDDPFLAELKELGCELVPFAMPEGPAGALTFVLSVEAAAMFDELTRSDRDDELTRQIRRAWPNVFRASRLVPAVEYLQAQRLRGRLMRQLKDALDTADVEVLVHPTHGNPVLSWTNLTGHPSISAPRGFRGDGSPGAVGFTGRVYGDARLLALVQAWQTATGHGKERRPPIR